MRKRFQNATIVGWHSHRNTGDDAMLQVIIWLMSCYFQVSEFGLLVSRNRIPYIFNKNIIIKPIYFFENNRLTENINKYLRLKFVKKSDVIIFGGGSIFHSLNSVEWKMRILKVVQNERSRNLALALGISFGPFKNIAAQRLCALFISKLDGVVVRDIPSYEFARKLLPKERVLLTSDLSLMLPKILKIKEKSNLFISKKRLGISLKEHPLGWRKTRFIIKEITESINDLIDKEIINEVVLFSFCGDRCLGDNHIIKIVKKLLNKRKSNISVYEYNPSPFEFLKEIKKCHVFLGMRLHSQIYSYITEVPFVAIIYHQKCRNFMNMIGADESVIIELNKIRSSIISEKIERALIYGSVYNKPYKNAEKEMFEKLRLFFSKLN